MELTRIDMSNKHIKAAKNVIAKLLTLMINQMLNTGIFPDKLKQSKVTPFFSSFFFFRKNYLLLSYATSVRPSVRPSVRLWK